MRTFPSLILSLLTIRRTPIVSSLTHKHYHHISFKMSPIRETLIKTANSYIAGFNTNTAEGVIACRTADCKQVIQPSSVPPAWASSPRSNEEYQAFTMPDFQMVRNLQIRLAKGEDMLVDEVKRKVLLPLMSSGETDFGPYSNKYMILL